MSPPGSVGARELLDAIAEPSLILHSDGTVVTANRAATRQFGALSGRSLTELTPQQDAPALLEYLHRCSGTREVLPGTANLAAADGNPTRFRCHASLVTPAQEGMRAQLLLRLSSPDDERFTVLAGKVRNLNKEIRERRRSQALLEATIADREVMLRELHHRVKNNIQTLAGLIGLAERDALNPETKAILIEVSRRLAAIGVVHQMLYRPDALATLNAAEFARELSTSILDSFSAGERLSFEAATEATIPSDAATPLALILNELLVNAAKHGRPDGRIHVAFRQADRMLELSVEDDGPGFDLGQTVRRASGLGLVRGLTRQLDGRFTVERSSLGGARCVVSFEPRPSVQLRRNAPH
jgi:two-component sensor histidine kinase